MNRTFIAILVPIVAGAASAALAQSPSTSRTYLIPHVLEKQGTVNTTPFTFDTDIIAALASPLPGARPPQGGNGRKAGDIDTLHVYVYNDDGTPWTSAAGTDVCNPCTYDLDGTHRRVVVSLDAEIMAKGGFNPAGTPATPMAGFAIVVVDGSDPADVAIDVMLETSEATARRDKYGCCSGHVTLIK